jgi:hypothetical protein
MLILLIEKLVKIKKINESFSIAKRANLLENAEIKQLFQQLNANKLKYLENIYLLYDDFGFSDNYLIFF